MYAVRKNSDIIILSFLVALTAQEERSRANLATRPSLIAGESEPSMSFAAAPVNSGKPVIGRYSWSSVASFRRISVA